MTNGPHTGASVLLYLSSTNSPPMTYVHPKNEPMEALLSKQMGTKWLPVDARANRRLRERLNAPKSKKRSALKQGFGA